MEIVDKIILTQREYDVPHSFYERLCDADESNINEKKYIQTLIMQI